MKLVILADGLGTRLSEETDLPVRLPVRGTQADFRTCLRAIAQHRQAQTGARPKPMVKIGGRPILWHIMKPGTVGRVPTPWGVQHSHS